LQCLQYQLCCTLHGALSDSGIRDAQ
jgi:hypothetical protein